MNILKESTEETASSSSIRALNDQLPKYGLGGKIVVTSGIQNLDAAQQREIFYRIRSFDAFSEENGPYGEHDCATIGVGELSAIFKIDYYDKDGQFYSPDPADPVKTLRIMTVMLSDEY